MGNGEYSFLYVGRNDIPRQSIHCTKDLQQPMPAMQREVGDMLAVAGAAILTGGAIAYGIDYASNSSESKEKAEEKVVAFSQSKKQAYFPENPYYKPKDKVPEPWNSIYFGG